MLENTKLYRVHDITGLESTLKHLQNYFVGRMIRVQDITGCQKEYLGVCVAIRSINEAGHFMLELRGSNVCGMWYTEVAGESRYVGFYPEIVISDGRATGKVSKYSLGSRNIEVVGTNRWIAT